MLQILKYSIFLFLMFFIGCSQESKHAQLADEISYSLITDISKKYPMHYYCASGQLMTNVNTMSVDVGIVKLCNVEEARKLVVNYAEEYLYRINHNEKIRPYLTKYPFTYKEIDLLFGFFDKDQKRPDPNYVVMVSLLNGDLYYYKKNPSSPRHDFIHKEPYEEALKIANQGNLE